MSEEVEVTDQKEVDISEKVDKEEMISFLTSSGKIKEEFAGSLYDQGLNSWQVLIEGTEDYFTGLKRVGPARAKILLDLAIKKKEELGASRPGLKEVLETIPRMSQRIISNLLENGYDSFESFKDKTAEDLAELKGIGPKMSEAIHKAVQDHMEIYGTGEAEEATAEMVEEEKEGAKDERSFVQRIVDAIGGLLGGKKKEEEEGEKEPEEIPEEEVSEEPPEEKESVQEEKIEEEPPEEPPVEEEPPEEETDEEPPVEPEEEKEEEVPEEVEEEKPEEEKGFFDKLKSMLFGGSKKEETPEEEIKEDVEAPVEDESAPEEGSPEEPPEEEETGEEESEVEPEKTFEDFEDIPGVSKKTAEMLKGAGYLNIDELGEAVPEDLTMIDGIGPKTAEKICNALKK